MVAPWKPRVSGLVEALWDESEMLVTELQTQTLNVYAQLHRSTLWAWVCTRSNGLKLRMLASRGASGCRTVFALPPTLAVVV